jgi:16S rRNA (cytosine1402-N4)-methyltransferase
MPTVHVPILVKPIVNTLIEPFLHLSPSAEPHWILDCTLGGGGHVAALLEAFNVKAELKRHKVLAIDQDSEAIQKANIRFEKQIREGQLELIHMSFGEAEMIVKGRPVLGLLADLGLSSDQLASPVRGFSFQTQGELERIRNHS